MKKELKSLKKVLGTLAFAFAMTLVMGMTTKAAAPGNVTTFVQSDATTSSITLKWNAVSGAKEYYILDGSVTGNVFTPTSVRTSTSATSYTINGLAKGEVYAFAIKTGNADGYSTGVWTTVCTVAGNPSQFMAGYKSDKKIEVAWNGTEYSVFGYELEAYNGSKRIYKKNLKTNSAVIKNIKNKKFYKLRVRSYVETSSGKKYSGWTTMYTSNAVDVYEASRVNNNTNIKINWKKVSGAKSYTIYARKSSSSKFKKVAKVGKKVSTYTIKKISGKKLARGTKYDIYVVASKKVGKKTYNSIGAYRTYTF